MFRTFTVARSESVEAHGSKSNPPTASARGWTHSSGVLYFSVPAAKSPERVR